MNVEELKIQISLDLKELNCIAFSILHDLRDSVKSHYKNHEPRVFDEQTGEKQKLGRELFGILGMSGQWDSEINNMKKIISENQ